MALHGRWQTSPAEYIDAVARYSEEVGGLMWAAPNGLDVRTAMLARTGLTVVDHQARTTGNPAVFVVHEWQAFITR